MEVSNLAKLYLWIYKEFVITRCICNKKSYCAQSPIIDVNNLYISCQFSPHVLNTLMGRI